MKVLIIGAARSGTQAALLLAAHHHAVTLTDMKQIDAKRELEEAGVQVLDHGHPEFLKMENWDLIVKNPGIPYHAPFVQYFVEKQVRIVNEIEVASWFTDQFAYAAVTGTNGKTTTTTLLAELLQRKRPNARAAGNIGVPLSEIVREQGDQKTDIALEVAAFQLVAMEKFHPVVSVCMNLTPDHLDYFGSLDAYYEAKMRVWKNQRDDDWFLINLDDPEIVRRCADLPCQGVTFSLNQPADLCLRQDQVWLFDQPLFALSDLHLPGKHNLQNAMVAAAMAVKMGVSADQIRMGIQAFKGVEHRIEFVAEIQGARYYNDSKGTNVDATCVALNAFDKPVILLAGGYDKKTGFEGLKPVLERIKTMIVYGETRAQLKALRPDAIVVETMQEAVDQAYQLAGEGDIVLLSPVCASWDQFTDYEQRGRQFKEQVHALAEQSAASQTSQPD
ncbi:UDP-N-acetylmuramoyl-L-alanine--D-glutamate ligase [Holdemania massiliensis]|uniref:UDP-N-acetylmuramoyl-L-alanine--D-glutamate ligase n=1 Tax=Holdemania massiliensis TaxID=1468449 RepID=UPI003567D29A